MRMTVDTKLMEQCSFLHAEGQTVNLTRLYLVEMNDEVAEAPLLYL